MAMATLMDLWEDFASNDFAYQDSVVRSIVRVLMNKDHVAPAASHEDIAGVMREWRRHGVFVVANTSTLSGCEIPTVRFLKKYYDSCFDGIVFPRNHDGNGKITKAAALGMTLDELSNFGVEPTFAMHIDDTTHHIEAMLTTPPHPNMGLFMPRFASNAALEGREPVVHGDDSLEVFSHADAFVWRELQANGYSDSDAASDRMQRAINAALLRAAWLSR